MKKSIKNLLLYLSLFVTIVTFNSCTTEVIEDSNSESEINEVLTTDTDSNLTQINVNGTILTVEQLENGDYAFGDMIFPKVLFSDDDSSENLGAKSLSVGRIGNRWPDNIVPYYIESSNNQIEKAIRHVELFTNLRFYETSSAENPYALGIYDGVNTCGASVGYIDDAAHSNFINVGGCNTTNSIVHEIGHVLGLWHEQSRADRDDYIEVYLENTLEDYQFQIYGGGSDGFEYTEFDFNSIMLYDSYTTSSNGQPVMTKVDGDTFESNSSGQLSDLDIEGLNEMYPATETKLYSILGQNGFYVSSENGKSAITCNRSKVGSWERFIITPIRQGAVVIQDNRNKKYLTYSEDDNSFIFNGTSIENAISFAVTENFYGQSDLFYANWYYNLTSEISGSSQSLSIDEDSNGTLRLGTSYEFRITLIN